MLDLARLFSPHQLNPFDINPLRKIISEHIDFEALRSPRAIGLFIAATRLSTGTLKLFENAAFLRGMRILPSPNAKSISNGCRWERWLASSSGSIST